MSTGASTNDLMSKINILDNVFLNDETILQHKSQEVDKPSGIQDFCMPLMIARERHLNGSGRRRRL